MTVHKYYIGGMGPYLYDDTEALNDPDGDFPGEVQHGLITSGAIKAEGITTIKFTEVFTSTGTISSSSQIVLASGTYDLFLPTLANGEDYIYEIKNTGSGLITLKPNVTEPAVTIEGEVSQGLGAGNSLSIISDNVEWWVI